MHSSTNNAPDNQSGNSSNTLKKIAKITGKTLLWIVGSVVGLVLLIMILLYLPPIQKVLTNKAENFLVKKLDTKVEIEAIRLGFPMGLDLEEVYIEDQQEDTLLYAKALNANINPLALLKKTLQVTEIELEGVYANVWVKEDSSSNITFITEAFATTDSTKTSSDQTSTQVAAKDTTGGGFVISLGGADLKDIRLKYRDDYNGNDADLNLGRLKINVNDFDLQKSHFGVKSLLLENTEAKYVQTKLPPPSPKEPDTTSGIGFQIDVDKIDIKNVNAFYQSNVSGQQVDMRLSELSVDAQKTNLGSQEIIIKDISLQDTYFAYQTGLKKTALDSAVIDAGAKIAEETEQVAGTETDEGKPWKIKVKNLNLDGNELLFADKSIPKKEFGFDPNHIHFENIGIKAKDFKFYPDNIAADISSITALDKRKQFELQDFEGNIRLDSVGVALNNLKIKTSRSQIGQKVKIDAPLSKISSQWQKANIAVNLDGTEIALADVFYFVPELTEQVSLSRNTDEKIQLSGQLSGKTNDLAIQNLEIKGLSQTQILLDGKVKGLPEVEKMYIDARLKPLRTSRTDLNKIVPKGTLPAGYRFPSQMLARANVEGSMQDMFVELFADLDNTKIQLGGTIKNPTNPEKLYLDISTKQFLVYLEDVKRWIPDTLLPQNITLPSKVNGDINFTGYLNDFNTNTALNTSLGNVGLKGKMRNLISENESPIYKATVDLENILLGKILQDTTLGVVALDLTADGSGFEPEKIKASIKGTVQKFEYQDYLYENLSLNGNVNGLAYDGSAKMNDENLDFDFNGNVVWDFVRPKFIAKLDVKKADLQALNLYKDSLTLALKLRADIVGKDLDDLKGDVNIKQVVVQTDGREFRVDSAAFVSISQKGETNIDLKSDIISAHIEGNLDLSTFVATAKNHINSYIQIDPVEPQKEISPQQMDFDIQIHRSELITALIPNLNRFEPASFSGKYRSTIKKLEINGVFPKIVYNQIDVDSLTINVDSDSQNLLYYVSVAEIETGAYQFEHPSISGQVANNKADLNIKVKDEEQKPRFNIGLELLRPDTTQFVVSLKEEQILDYEKWQARPSNKIILGENLAIRDFMISHDNQTFTAQTTNNDQDLRASFTDFDMATLTDIASPNDTTKLVGGTLNGRLKIQNLQSEPQFLADLSISELIVLNSKLGDMTIEANNSTASKRYDVDVKLRGENKFNLTGYYNATAGASDALNMDLDIARLSLPSIENLTMGNISEAKGTISGNLDVRGTTTDPTILGELEFNGTEFLLSAIGTYIKLPRETIEFDERGINFENFVLLDRKDNELAVKGRINTQDYTTFNFDMNIEGDRFRFVDSDKDSGNEMFYGKGIANVDVGITGTLTSLVIDADVDVLEGTDLTYRLPEPDIATIDKEGVVEFVDMPYGSDTLVNVIPPDPSDTVEYAQNMDITAAISIEPEAKISVVIDPSNQLQVQGGGDLNFNLNPSGQMSITGRYEIKDGTYNLNFYNLAKKEFEIREGGYLVFYGDVMDIRADLTAIHRVDAAPYELMANQIGNASEQELNKYKQELPFEVILNLSGEILDPSINFDIEMEEDERGALGGTVNTRLQLLNRNESELNKQVFALLILGGFISENPLDRAGGEMGFAESTARNTVSNLLTSQLNKLADKNLKGFDLSFDLQSYEDYSTGESRGRTELGVNLSKSFMDDRLTFQVGSNIDLEGEAAREQQAQGLSGLTGDVIISYLLTEDGRYKVQIFRENNYGGIIDGQLIETGAAIIFTREYDEVSELFNKNESKEQKKSKNKDNEDEKPQQANKEKKNNVVREEELETERAK